MNYNLLSLAILIGQVLALYKLLRVFESGIFLANFRLLKLT